MGDRAGKNFLCLRQSAVEETDDMVMNTGNYHLSDFFSLYHD